ncbi:MAG: host attachment protein [Nitrospirota bacterium]|nr:host attachment protein [Nitrospirota bacterium]
MDKLIIAVDLGHFRAYKLSTDSPGSPKINLVESYDSVEGHGRLGEKLSDEAGRFGMGGGKSGAAKGYGEPHNIELESEKKAAKLIARDIAAIIEREKIKKWWFAAANKMNSLVIENLDPDIRSRMDKNINSNLTNTKKSAILKHFE